MLSKKAILHTCKIHESYPAPFSLSQGKEGEEGITQTPQDTWFGISCETWMHSLMLGSWVTPSRAMNSVSHHRGKSSILLCNVCKITQDASSSKQQCTSDGTSAHAPSYFTNEGPPFHELTNFQVFLCVLCAYMPSIQLAVPGFVDLLAVTRHMAK